MSAAQDGETSPARWNPKVEVEQFDGGGRWPVGSLMDMLDDPRVNLVPHSYDPADPPGDLEEKTTLYSVLRALRQKVHQTDNNQQVICAAWHAEPWLRRLCAEFDNPIAGFRVTDDSFIVADIGFPEESENEGKIAFGPLGTVAYKIGNRAKFNAGSTKSTTVEGWIVSATVEDDLRGYGLPTRQEQ